MEKKKKKRSTNVQLALEGQLVASDRSDEEKRRNPSLRCVLCLQILSAAAKVQIKSCTIQRGEMVVLCLKVCVCVFGCVSERLSGPCVCNCHL